MHEDKVTVQDDGGCRPVCLKNWWPAAGGRFPNATTEVRPVEISSAGTMELAFKAFHEICRNPLPSLRTRIIAPVPLTLKGPSHLQGSSLFLRTCATGR
jgi:hypothetical protein